MNKLSPAILALLMATTMNAYASSHGVKNDMESKQKHQHKHMGEGHKMAMKHANPLPNFMKVIKKHGAQLSLSEQQAAALKAWRDENNKIVHNLATEVKSAEKSLHDAAFTEASQADLQDLMDKVLHLRLQLAQYKMRCRENMRNVLNDDQWKQVVNLYQNQVLAKK